MFPLNVRKANLVKKEHLGYWILQEANKLLCVARKCILFNWIHEKPPSVTQWYREIYKVLPMERLSAKLKDREDNFMNVWRPLIDYLPRVISTLIYKGKGSDSLDWRAPAVLLQFAF